MVNIPNAELRMHLFYEYVLATGHQLADAPKLIKPLSAAATDVGFAAALSILDVVRKDGGGGTAAAGCGVAGSVVVALITIAAGDTYIGAVSHRAWTPGRYRAGVTIRNNACKVTRQRC